MNNYDKFKKRGPFRMEKALVGVLIALITVLIIIPRSERESKNEKETKIIFIESVEIPPVDLQKTDVPEPTPVIPVMEEGIDTPIDSTLFVWDFDTYEGSDTPPPPLPTGSISNEVDFTPYDEPPVPIGGMAAIARNVIYPDIAKEAGIEGTVYIQSYIDEKGVVLNCVVNKGMPGTGLDEAAMDAIKKTKWKPALQGDRKVGVWIAIPVTFKLNTR